MLYNFVRRTVLPIYVLFLTSHEVASASVTSHEVSDFQGDRGRRSSGVSTIGTEAGSLDSADERTRLANERLGVMFETKSLRREAVTVMNDGFMGIGVPKQADKDTFAMFHGPTAKLPPLGFQQPKRYPPFVGRAAAAGTEEDLRQSGAETEEFLRDSSPRSKGADFGAGLRGGSWKLHLKREFVQNFALAQPTTMIGSGWLKFMDAGPVLPIQMDPSRNSTNCIRFSLLVSSSTTLDTATTGPARMNTIRKMRICCRRPAR